MKTNHNLIMPESHVGKSPHAGFTVVELLVVIAIVAVLAAIVLVNVTSYIAKGRRSSVVADLGSMLNNSAAYFDGSSTGYTGFHSDAKYLNPKTSVETVTGANTVVENETSTAFCACAPLPDISGSTNQTFCVDSTGAKYQTGVICSDECQSSGSCVNTSVSGGILNGLVGYWKLDESSGSTAADSSGNGNSGTYNGATSSTSVPTVHFTDPYSRSLNGTSDFIRIPTPSIINSLTTATVSTWIKTTNSSSREFILSTWDGTNGFQLFINGSGKDYLWADSNATGLAGTKIISDGNWHHLVMVLDGTTGYLYVDGTLDVTAARTMHATTRDVQIGAE